MANITGTAGSDTLDGTAGADTISGLDGNDRINGRAGDDVIDGGDGDDSIEDDGGSDLLRGGAGNDNIRVGRNGTTSPEQVRVEAGGGNDSLSYQNYRSGFLVADMGDGDDAVSLIVMQDGGMRVTLGAGRDTVSFHQLMSSADRGTLTITDFAAGAAGDKLDIAEWLNRTLINWDGSANPFGASGFLRLVQSGTSALLQIDRDGAAGTHGYGFNTLITFENTTASLLTAENFGGLPPDGSSVAGQIITGTVGPDTLDGTAGPDTISGLDGSDRINGKAGSDTINGGLGSDTIQGGTGDDVIDGGDGDDSIEDDGGSDLLRGGAGNDNIRVGRNGTTSPEQVRVEAGGGNDSLSYQNYRSGSLIADMGDGDDTVTLIVMQDGGMRVTLGAGRDTVLFHQLMSSSDTGTLTVSDFTVGAAGDRFNITEWLNTTLINWNGSANPFNSGGYLRLVQAGTATLLQMDRDGASSGYGYKTLATFENATASQFTAENFSGFAPTVVNAAEAATAYIVAPTVLTEGVDASGALSLTLKNVSRASGTISMSFVASSSTATNGSDVSVASFSSSYSITQLPAGDYKIDLPSVEVLNDLLAEGDETIAIRITAPGQTFDTGTDSKIIQIKLVDDEIAGTEGADVLAGTEAGDIIEGRGGDDRIDGRGGVDTALFRSTLALSSVAFESAGNAIVSGRDGRDTLVNVEQFRFTDGVINAAAAAPVGLAYQTWGGRVASGAELAFWTGEITAGRATVEAIKTAILSDPVGRANTAATVSNLYREYLGRDASTDEIGYWDAQVRNGLDFAGVRQVLVADPSSQAHGALKIGQLYREYLGREAGADEVAFWVGQVRLGSDFAVVRSALLADPGGRANTATAVTGLYDEYLGRTPNAEELAFWSGQVAAGTDFAGIRRALVNDPAGRANTVIEVGELYRDYLGRDASANEIVFWDGQVRGGSSFADVRAAILDDQSGRTYTTGVLEGLYQELFGRAASEQDQAVWAGLFRSGADLDAARAALMTDVGSAGLVAQARGTAGADSFAFTAASTHLVIDGFDPLADVIDLRGSGFGGNPLSAGRAREIERLDGGTDVFVSFDAGHDILIRGMKLTQLGVDDFMI